MYICPTDLELKLNLAFLLVKSGARVDVLWKVGLAAYAATGRGEVRDSAGINATPTINTMQLLQ